MQQRSEQQRQRQREIENEFDAFVYAVGHDLHAPVRGILHFSRLLERKCADRLQDKELELLQRIPQMAAKTQAMLDGLLELSRLGRRDWHVAPQDMNQLVAQAIDHVRRIHPDRAVDFAVPDHLPAVQGDHNSCVLLLVELLSNALLFNQQQTVQVRVAYDAKAQGFLVADNGIGINESGCERIFDAFCRLHHEADYGGGLGLGLTRASKIVRLHGGHVRVESTANSGSTFFFELPLKT